ncbi:MAG: hypothetical protein OSB38_42160 [Paraburkholderia fungorum]|nr:hypothetical protein [Paraburkholderia fungorum]
MVPTHAVVAIIYCCLAVALKLAGVKPLEYCFMSNHHHLIVTEIKGNLPDDVNRMNYGDTLTVRRQSRRSGPAPSETVWCVTWSGRSAGARAVASLASRSTPSPSPSTTSSSRAASARGPSSAAWRGLTSDSSRPASESVKRPRY